MTHSPCGTDRNQSRPDGPTAAFTVADGRMEGCVDERADCPVDKTLAHAPPPIVAANADETPRCPLRPHPRRWLLAMVGLLCVGLGGIGVFVPGLPTTVFLLIASWCFTRSCPWLEERLIRNRFFQPFLVYLEPDSVMPMRARIVALAAMWTAITVSSVLLTQSGGAFWLPLLLVALGGIGTYFIWTIRRGHSAAVPA